MPPQLTVELMACEMVLMQDIAEPTCTQKSLAITYAMAICSRDKPDWLKVNKAIIDRWSVRGLENVKKMAWKLIEEKKGQQQ